VALLCAGFRCQTERRPAFITCRRVVELLARSVSRRRDSRAHSIAHPSPVTQKPNRPASSKFCIRRLRSFDCAAGTLTLGRPRSCGGRCGHPGCAGRGRWFSTSQDCRDHTLRAPARRERERRIRPLSRGTRWIEFSSRSRGDCCGGASLRESHASSRDAVRYTPVTCCACTLRSTTNWIVCPSGGKPAGE
jgi:hypothetical protein